MSTTVEQTYAWFPLPASPLNPTSIKAMICLDGANTFAYDGTNASVFNWQSKSWSPAVPMPELNIGSGYPYGVVVSQVYNGYYMIIGAGAANNEFWLCTLSQGFVRKTTSYDGGQNSGPGGNGNIYSSYFESYLNRGWFFPAFSFDYVQSSFYIAGLPNYLFLTFNGNSGPEVAMTLVLDVTTGFIIFQSGDLTEYSTQGELQATVMPGTVTNISGSVFYDTGELSYDFTHGGLIFGNAITLQPSGFIQNASVKPAIFPTAYAVEGFYLTLQSLGVIYEEFCINVFNGGNTVTWIPYDITLPERILGEFLLPLTINAPTVIEKIFGGNNNSNKPANWIAAGRIFGYFFHDFSGGYYLGIGSASFTTYDMLNYRKIDGAY